MWIAGRFLRVQDGAANPRTAHMPAHNRIDLKRIRGPPEELKVAKSLAYRGSGFRVSLSHRNDAKALRRYS